MVNVVEFFTFVKEVGLPAATIAILIVVILKIVDRQNSQAREDIVQARIDIAKEREMASTARKEHSERIDRLIAEHTEGLAKRDEKYLAALEALGVKHEQAMDALSRAIRRGGLRGHSSLMQLKDKD